MELEIDARLRDSVRLRGENGALRRVETAKED